MRVAILVRTFPNLSQTFVLNQIIGLLERGHDVDIYAERMGDERQSYPSINNDHLRERTTYFGIPDHYGVRLLNGLRLWLAEMRKSRRAGLGMLNVKKYGIEAISLRLIFEVAAFRGRGPYDVVHCHFGPMGVIGTKLRDLGLLAGPLITTFYGYDVTQTRFQIGYPFLFKYGDLVIAISDKMRQQLIVLGCPPQKIIIHKLGIDLRPYGLGTFAQRDKICIITIARFVPKKGLEYGLQAIAELVKQGIDLKYIIVGDGPLRLTIERLIIELNLTPVVTLMGWQMHSEVIRILQQADILLSPSVTASDHDTEGTPVTIMEGMAAGLPIVATQHSGIPEIVIDGVSGYLVPERDAPALAQALNKLISAPEQRHQMGKAGRQFVEAHHNIDTLNNRLTEIYHSLTRT
jgi:colanic acid/amylovoran biosynthesis glycosyltransferase